jgi:hypothetical protein
MRKTTRAIKLMSNIESRIAKSETTNGCEIPKIWRALRKAEWRWKQR